SSSCASTRGRVAAWTMAASTRPVTTVPDAPTAMRTVRIDTEICTTFPRPPAGTNITVQRSVDLVDTGDDRGDVVVSAALAGELDEVPRGLLRGERAHGLADLRGLQQAGEAVGAEQEAIT